MNTPKNHLLLHSWRWISTIILLIGSLGLSSYVTGADAILVSAQTIEQPLGSISILSTGENLKPLEHNLPMNGSIMQMDPENDPDNPIIIQETQAQQSIEDKARAYRQMHQNDALNTDKAPRNPLMPYNDPVTATIDDNQVVTGSVSGIVTDSTNAAFLSGITVCVYQQDGNFSGCEETDLNGQYLFSTLPVGQYIADVYEAGWAFVHYSNKTNWADADQFAVLELQETSGIDFALEPGGMISGTVTDSGSTLLQNVFVTARGSNGSGWTVGTCTNVNGEYSFPYLPLNDGIRLSANEYDYCGVSNAYSPEYWQETRYSWQATPITMTLGSRSVSGIDFTLEIGGSISGVITAAVGGQPVEGVFVWASGDNGFGGATTNASGQYEITGLATGEYRLDVEKAGYAIEYYNNKYSPSLADLVSVTAGQNTPGINFALETGGSVSGTVTNLGGTPLEGVFVAFQFEGGANYYACTSASGNYSFTSLPYNNPFRVLTDGSCFDTSNYVDEYWQDTSYYTQATLLTATAQQSSITGINFTLELGGSISGTVTDAQSDLPLSDVFIDANSTSSGNNEYGWTDQNGEYTIFGLPAGTVVVNVQEVGYAFEFYDNKQGLDSADPVAITAGQNTPGIDFALDPAGSVSGVVRDISGNPLPNIAVTFDFGVLNYQTGPCTDAFGAYSFTSIPYDKPFTVSAGWYCGNPNTYQEEFWQEVDNQADATPLTITSQTLSFSNIDFTLLGPLPENPQVSSLSSNSGMKGSAGVPLIVYGSSFDQSSVIRVDGTDLVTTYTSDGILQATIPASNLNNVAIINITVYTPPPGGGTSNTLTFNVYSFADVLPTVWHWRWVEGFYAQGITTGCGAPSLLQYCPDRAVTRAEMAVFILRAQHVNELPYTPSPDPSVVGAFGDVPVPDKEWMKPWIEEFYENGITTGCGVGIFCPERQVTRAEMAVFILRAIHGAGYTPPEATGSFTDVPVAGKEWMQPWIEQFYQEGITTGCATAPLRYCPEQVVTRAEMAVFIDRAFGFAQLP